jgi:hypothetical protein
VGYRRVGNWKLERVARGGRQWKYGKGLDEMRGPLVCSHIDEALRPIAIPVTRVGVSVVVNRVHAGGVFVSVVIGHYRGV